MRREGLQGRTIWVTKCPVRRRWHAQEYANHMSVREGRVHSDVSICDTNGIARAIAAIVPNDGMAHPLVMTLQTHPTEQPVALHAGREDEPENDAARFLRLQVTREMRLGQQRELPDGLPELTWMQEPDTGGQIMMRHLPRDPSARAAEQARVLQGDGGGGWAQVADERAEQGPMVHFPPVSGLPIPFGPGAEQMDAPAPLRQNDRIQGCDCADCAATTAELRAGAAW